MGPTMPGNKLHLCKRRTERGYILLVLLLLVALLSIGFLAVVERLDFQIKRDREEELIHRGVQYSRAVRKFVKKFGRYPESMEALENTNNVRFLRKRYKDPITGRDFKVLHYIDLATIQSSTPGVKVTDIAAQQQAAPGTLNNVPSVGPGLDPNSPPRVETVTDYSGNTYSTDSVQSDSSNNAAQDPSNPPSTSPAAQQTQANEEVPGQGAVIGVVSYSKAKTIRVFNKQDHYDHWRFVYDPSTDKGPMNTPQVPLLRAAQPVQQENGQSPAGSAANPEQQTSATVSPNLAPSQQ